MRKFDKAIILLIGAGILFNFLKEQFYKDPNVIVVAGHRVDKQPCLTGMNELFGRGIDASKMCDCLIPKFYPLIKDDPAKVKSLKRWASLKQRGRSEIRLC
jgi:hypothetical protein